MFGGCVSLLINMLMLVYILILVKALVLFEQDEILTVSHVIENEDIEDINYNETDYMISFAMQNWGD